MIYEAELGLDIYKTVLASQLDVKDQQEDLFYCESVLVSLGTNGNDDVFVKEDTWKARNTPVDKQFNFMHDEADIIGHITSSKVVSNNIIVPDNTPLEQVPDQFDIIVKSVIYKKFRTDTLQSRANKLIEEIKNGEWYVSMECWHKSFDYLLTKDSDSKIIARNEKTAFLTKHLRRFKGTGEFEGYKVNRILRDFYFGGKGLVRQPANKTSVFLGYSEEKSMSSYTVEQYKALEDKLAIAEKQAQEVASQAVANEIKGYKDQIKKLEDELKAKSDSSVASLDKANVEIKSLQDQLTVANEVAKNKTEQCVVLEKAKADLEVKLSEQAEVLKKIEADKVKASRLAKFSAVDIADDKAKALVEQFITVSDEVFDNLVSSFPAKKTTPKVEASVLDDFEDPTDPTLALAHVEGATELREKTSAWLKNSFIKKKK